MMVGVRPSSITTAEALHTTGYHGNLTFTVAGGAVTSAFDILRGFGEVSCGTGWDATATRGTMRKMAIDDLPDTTCNSLYARGEAYMSSR